MGNEQVIRDERTVAVENAGYRLAYIVLTFGMLLSAVLRALFLKQACWDLFALLILSGGVATFHQVRHRTLSRRWLRAAILVFLIGAMGGLVSLAVMMLLKR